MGPLSLRKMYFLYIPDVIQSLACGVCDIIAMQLQIARAILLYCRSFTVLSLYCTTARLCSELQYSILAFNKRQLYHDMATSHGQKVCSPVTRGVTRASQFLCSTREPSKSFGWQSRRKPSHIRPQECRHTAIVLRPFYNNLGSTGY